MERQIPPIRPITYTYNLFLRKAPTIEVTTDWLDKMKQANLPADASSYQQLMIKTDDFILLQVLLEDIKQAKLPPNVLIYTKLINKAPNFEQAKALFWDMKKASSSRFETFVTKGWISKF